jgi:hypothetical protein
VIPASASAFAVCGSINGWSSPRSAWPLRITLTSEAEGFWTRSTTSDWPYRSTAETTVAPASA